MVPFRSCLLLLAAANAAAAFATDELIAISAEQAGKAGIAAAALADMKATGGIRLPAQVVVPPSRIEVITAPLPAMVAAVRIGHGETVKKGQVLARLQGAPLLELQREFAQARSQASLAIENLRRDESLYADGIIPQGRLSATRAAERQAALALAEKSQSLRLAGLAEPGAQAALASGADIRAPFDGVVSERYAQRGEYLQVGAAVAHLVDTGRLEARVLAPLALASRLQAGQEVEVRQAGQSRPLKVRTVVPVGDERSRQFELRVALPPGFALVGAAIDVAIPEDGGATTLTVPRDALVLRDARTYVMRVTAENTAEPVDVAAGAARDARVEVRGELHAGDRVVVRGAERLSPGQAVNVVGSG